MMVEKRQINGRFSMNSISMNEYRSTICSAASMSSRPLPYLIHKELEPFYSHTGRPSIDP
jgi:hypothetical protein